MTEPILIRKSPIVIIKDLLLLEFLVTVAYFLAAVLANYGELYQAFPFSHTISYVIAKFLFIAFAELAIISSVFLRWLYTAYTIYPASIVKERGVVFKHRESIPLKHPLSASSEFGSISQLFGYGTLVIHTAGREKPVKLTHVPNPQLYAQMIEESHAEQAFADAENSDAPETNIEELLHSRERENLEFKSSLRWDFHENKVNRELEKSALKTAVAFLNSKGGHLVIGVDDAGAIRGIKPDYATLRKPDADGFENHFTNLLKESVGPEFRRFLKLSFHQMGDKNICVVRVFPGARPAYLRFGNEEAFYIRTGNSTTALPVSAATTYIRSRWKKY